MPNLSDGFADEIVAHQIAVLRTVGGVTAELSDLLSQIEDDIQRQLRGASLTDASKKRLEALLANVRDSIAQIYSEIGDAHAVSLFEIAKTELRAMQKIGKELVGVDLFTSTVPTSMLRKLTQEVLIQGAQSNDWWSRQAGDLAFKFAQQVRLGVAAGETNAQIVTRLLGNAENPGIMEGSRTMMETLVRTSVLQAANDARLGMFKANSDVIRGVQQVSTLDERTTETCIAYDGATWDLDGKPIEGTELPFDGGPPRHWNCRSVLIPLTITWKDLGVDMPELSTKTRASMDGQVAATTNFKTWFEKRSEAQQNEILGAGKAQLYRDGKISVSQLVNSRGNPLSLEKLQAKYA